MRRAALLVAMLGISLLGMASVGIVHSASSPTWAHAASAQLPADPNPSASDPSGPTYDEQIGITFTQSFTSLAYNVTALAQSDSDGYGPAYLLNGLTDNGYWYQVGVAYNWPYSTGGHVSGYEMNYEVFDSAGNSIFPSKGGGGTFFSGPVSSGDVVLLSLRFSGSDVVMSAYDWQTGSSASESYSATGSEFIGLSAKSNSNGFFTGLMTEWYHVSPYYGSEAEVTYSDSTFALSSGYVWADEYDTSSPNSPLFNDLQYFSFQNTHQLQSFSSNGANAYADATTFITGSLTTGILTLSYSIQGGGYGYTPPTVTYTYNGAQHTVSLTTTPATYLVDFGSSWLVSNVLSSGSLSERWLAGGTTSGTVSSSVTENIVYYHQYLVNFSYSVHGGGSPPSGPVVQYSQSGATGSTVPGLSVWADAGSVYTFENPLPGQTILERWDDNGASGTIGAARTLNVTYYHQFAVAVSYHVVGGGSPVPPSEIGTEFGSPYTTQVPSQNSMVWFDSGTNWNLTNPLVGSTTRERWQFAGSAATTVGTNLSVSVVYYHQYAINLTSSINGGGAPTPPIFTASQYGQPFAVFFTTPVTDFFDGGSNWTLPVTLVGGSSGERWVATGPTSGVVAGQSAIQTNYDHQFHVSTGFSPGPGGSVANSTGWHNSGSGVQLSASPNSGWRFEGWTGSGAGSYSGLQNQTSVQITSPIMENATFYPGLEISSGANGAVSYSYGSQSGVVQAGASQTIYAPVGTVVSLTANPSSLFYKFKDWSPSTLGMTVSTTVGLKAPSALSASFAVNIVNVAGIIGAVAVVALAGVLALERRKKHPAMST